ncbi:hypothetical protein EB796_004951 [Bugula neritina]|uniref:Uncharacterized protein n=1 Tax=Bugula neritina TaxID=10212 RepID=A0A7J7KFS4_BUGNE|nr:hypothetical protein EB796_004951 [Bugula neritina]
MVVDQFKTFGFVLCQLLYFLLKLVTCLLQQILHRCNGVAAHRKRVFAGTDTTGQVAEVSRVIARLPGIACRSPHTLTFSVGMRSLLIFIIY